MGLVEGLPQPTRRHFRVDLRRNDVVVSAELLHGAQVGAVVEQMGKERMPEPVRPDLLWEPGPLRAVLQVPAHRLLVHLEPAAADPEWIAGQQGLAARRTEG